MDTKDNEQKITLLNEKLSSNRSQFGVDELMVWIQNYKSENTRQAYIKALRDFDAFLGATSLAEASARDCVDYRNWLAERYSNATINQYFAAIRAFYSYLVEHEVLAENPAAQVKGMRVEQFGKTKALNVKKNQDEKLLKSIDTHTELGIRDFAIILLLLTTGLRVSALAEAKVADLRQTVNGVVLRYVGKGKDGKQKEQEKRITQATLAAIKAYLAYRHDLEETAPLFATVANPKRADTQSGLPLTRHAITAMVQRVAQKAGIVGITAHTLRHSSALKMQALGLTVSQIQKQLDHSSIRTTLIYLDHVSSDDSDATFHALDDAFADFDLEKVKTDEGNLDLYECEHGHRFHALNPAQCPTCQSTKLSKQLRLPL